MAYVHVGSSSGSSSTHAAPLQSSMYTLTHIMVAVSSRCPQVCQSILDDICMTYSTHSPSRRWLSTQRPARVLCRHRLRGFCFHSKVTGRLEPAVYHLQVTHCQTHWTQSPNLQPYRLDEGPHRQAQSRGWLSYLSFNPRGRCLAGGNCDRTSQVSAHVCTFVQM